MKYYVTLIVVFFSLNIFALDEQTAMPLDKIFSDSRIKPEDQSVLSKYFKYSVKIINRYGNSSGLLIKVNNECRILTTFHSVFKENKDDYAKIVKGTYALTQSGKKIAIDTYKGKVFEGGLTGDYYYFKPVKPFNDCLNAPIINKLNIPGDYWDKIDMYNEMIQKKTCVKVGLRMDFGKSIAYSLDKPDEVVFDEFTLQGLVTYYINTKKPYIAGESGSPLFCKIEGKWTLSGVLFLEETYTLPLIKIIEHYE